MKKEILKSILILWLLGYTLISSATTYYVDSVNGNDIYNGISISRAWKSLAKVNSHSFDPGDTISFLRNCEWTGELTITSSGTELRPVIFTAYGKGTKPIIKNPGVNRAISIKIISDWVIVENFLVMESHAAGIYINTGAEHNIIRNNEATKVGIGISINGRHNLVTGNYAHDLIMVVNNEGGDNDYGAVGIWLYSSNNEVSYNRMISCKAPSYDYGFDGGVVEFYGDVDSCYVHHNWGENCVGAFEVGGGKSVTLSHNTVCFNVFINNGGAGGFHMGGKFGVKYEDWIVDNNVFIDTCHSNYSVGFWNGAPGPEDFKYRNNIFYIPNCLHVSNHTGFIHENNLFYLGGNINIGITPGPGDKTGDPLFVDINKNDFHLTGKSPAIDSGKNLGYTIDFDGNPIPIGSSSDIGPYEYTDK